MKQALLLINTLSDHPAGDELDVLVQAEAVEKALESLGYSPSRAYCGLNLEYIRVLLETGSPELVFNLVESVGGKGSLIHLPAWLLETSGIPFTGSPAYALMVTTDKVRTKTILREHRIPTPDWFPPLDPGKKYILKPIWEDGSAGITDASIVDGRTFDPEAFSVNGKFRDHFLEEYIDGREFNLTLLAGPSGPEVMPVAEMCYVDYPEDKPRILNFASKWEPASFEYAKTIRTFDLPEPDRELMARMKEISLKCWDVFEMRGYARVDFRVDRHNNPFVLEVNANPCISPDAGFVAACEKGGVDYTSMIARILTDVNL
jgi:D-alanine-D-alanine ligase